MIFAPPFSKVIESVDRRALGAVQFVDAVTRLPITSGVKLTARSATLAGAGAPIPVPLPERGVRIQQNRSGLHAILSAPFFDAYSASFDAPTFPPETPAGTRLRLRLGLLDGGPHYLPLEFDFDVPRSLDRADAENVFQPFIAELFRTPGAPVPGGWSVLRVRVTQAASGVPLPGVLVRVFRSPTIGGEGAIGLGMSEWRGGLRGEALVAVAEIPRFRPGGGANVFETAQAVHLEVTRDPAFTGAAGQLPDVPKIIAGTAGGLIRHRSDPPDPAFTVAPAAPLALRAGREITVHLTMS